MTEIDGRSIGGTGEYRGDHQPDRDIPTLERTDGPHQEFDCVRNESEGTWECWIDGEGANRFRRKGIEFEELDLDSDELEEEIVTRENGVVHYEARFPEPVECHFQRTEYYHVDVERRLSCPGSV